MGVLNFFKRGKTESVSVPVTPFKESKRAIADYFLVKKMQTSEKSVDLNSQNKYIFLVASKTNKPEIKKNIEASYGVKVNNVNVINIKGKIKRLGRSLGRTPNYKKAVITLAPGSKIEITR